MPAASILTGRQSPFPLTVQYSGDLLSNRFNPIRTAVALFVVRGPRLGAEGRRARQRREYSTAPLSNQGAGRLGQHLLSPVSRGRVREGADGSNASYFSMYSQTAATTVEWLQVKGDTLTGSPVMGWSCSAKMPLGRALAHAHSSRGIASLSSSRVWALAILYCAWRTQLQLPRGLFSPSIRWYRRR